MMMPRSAGQTTRLAATPEPPYFAVIFTSLLAADADGYSAMSTAMQELAARQDGYLGHESVRDEQGFGITVSYWRDEAAISAWRNNARHSVARALGRNEWIDDYRLRVARVERASTRALDLKRESVDG